MAYTEQLPNGRYRGVIRVNGAKRSKTFDYRYEAEAWGVEAEGRAAAAVESAAPAPAEPVITDHAAYTTTPTVGDHGRAWVERRSGRLAKSTRDGYLHHLRALDADGIGLRPMGDVARSEVERWQTANVRAGIGKPTINARMKVMRMVYVDALAERIVAHNPTTGVDYLTTDIKADRVLTEDDETALFRALAADDVLPVMVALDAGLRWQEVFALTAQDVMADYLVVRQVAQRTAADIRHYPKGHRSRVVPLSARLAAALTNHAKRVRLAGGPDALLFTTASGAPVDYFNYRHRVWRPAVHAAGLRPRPRFHDLRHTFGSRLAAAGVPRSELAKMMGHADEATTARYIHAGDDGRRLELLRAALAG